MVVPFAIVHDILYKVRIYIAKKVLAILTNVLGLVNYSITETW